MHNELSVTLDPAPSHEWKQVFGGITGVSFWPGRGPQTVRFQGAKAVLRAREDEASQALSQFKQWVSKANDEYRAYKQNQLEEQLRRDRDALAQARASEEERQRVVDGLQLEYVPTPVPHIKPMKLSARS